MRKAIVALSIAIAIAPRARAECVTESGEAVTLANDADKLVGSNPDDAISKYEQAFQLAPRSPRIASKLAAAYEKKETWAKAIATLEQASKLDPPNASYAFRLGRARFRAAEKGIGTYVDAREAFSSAVQLDSNWAEAHYELGNVLWVLDDEPHALAELTKAVQLGPAIAAHWAALADLYRRLGLVTQASKVVAEASRFLKGDDFEFSHVAGRVHERAGETSAAIASYDSAKRACGQCSGAAIIYFELGRAYAAAKRASEASSNLHSFQKMICKGGAAQRYADECTQTQAMMQP
jgi:tetratricopeptide (TPR) repeat protein